jgi:hypothetical protein
MIRTHWEAGPRIWLAQWEILAPFYISLYNRMAYNLHTLQKLKWVMEISLAKTLASKHKISVRRIYKKYQADLDVEGKKYKGLQVTIPREGKKPLVATWGGIPLTWDANAPIEDQLQQPQWGRRSELEKRLLAQMCEQCGATRMTEKSRFTTSGRSTTWKSTPDERSHNGFRSWLPADEKPWSSAIPAIWISNMDVLTDAWYHVHERSNTMMLESRMR